jgi:hypothetical protein
MDHRVTNSQVLRLRVAETESATTPAMMPVDYSHGARNGGQFLVNLKEF